MNPTRHPLSPVPAAVALVMALGAAAPARAQQPSAPTTPTAPTAPTLSPEQLTDVCSVGVAFAREGDRIVGVGPDYRITFDDAGVEFVPALGATAPRNAPLRFEFESVRRGETPMTAEDRVQPCLLDDVVCYDRGAVTERYELRDDGVEQTFVFDERPAGRGDLVVRGRVYVDHAARCEPVEGGGLRFYTAALGGVGVGAVLGVDAAGRTAPGALGFTGTHLELSLPDALVEVAAWPLVLDPLITAVFDISRLATQQNLNPDVAFEPTHEQYLVVWQRSMSALDADIMAREVSVDGVPGTFTVVSFSSYVSLSPSVAAVDVVDGFLIVWRGGTSAVGPWALHSRGAIFGPGGLNFQPSIRHFIPITGDPEVGGAIGTVDKALVVCPSANGVEIHSSTVTGLLSQRVLSQDADVTRVAITKTCGDQGHHLVVAEQYNDPTRPRLRAWVCTSLGFERSTGVITGLNDGAVRPAVDGDGLDFVVAYQRPDAPGATTHDIHAQRLRHLGGSAPTVAVPDTELEFGLAAGDDQTAPAVSFLGNKWLVAMVDADSGFNFHVYARAFHDDLQPCGPWNQVSFGALLNMAPRIATRYHGGSLSSASVFDQAMIVFHSGANVPPFDTNVRGRLFEAVGSGGAIQQLGPGCGNGGTLATNGPVAIGNAAFEFRLTGADSGSVLHGLGLGLPRAPLACGACAFVDGSYRFAGVGFDPTRATFRLPIPCSEVFLGVQLDAQGIAFGTAASPCPLAPSLSASNRLRVTIGL